jgi:hypothetical protein
VEPNKKRKLIRRYYAERYLLVTIISFALSVSLTRFFLNITGYPQIGGSQLHIAHVLWGGLLLFVGGLFPLIFANKRAFDLSALLSGAGVGLFIDEVGKFITRDNNYFFPAAAPIIYIFLLLVALILLLLRRRRVEDLRTTLFQAIERFEEILEEDLSKPEQMRMMRNIQSAMQDDSDPKLTAIARDLLGYLKEQENNLVPDQPDFLSSLAVKWLIFENEIFQHKNFFKWLASCWAVWGLITLIHPLVALLSSRTVIKLTGLWSSLLVSDLLAADPSLTGIIRLAGEAFSGLLLLAAVILVFKKQNRAALNVALIALLTMLSVINIFMFYFDQFSAIFYAGLQFLLLFVTIRYKKHLT